MIKALILDYGNVISKAAVGDCCLTMEKETGIPAEIFRNVYEEFRFDFDLGYITGAEMYRRLLVAKGYEEIAANSALMEKIARIDLESWKYFHQDVTDWALDLQKKGFKLGILSNMPYEFLDLYEKDIPLFVAADCAIFSCRVHRMKPDVAIYHDVLEGLAIKPEEAVFFDDVEENVIAAQNLGIHAFVWKDLTQGKKDLATLL